jgi:hypothetical protein
MKLKGKQNLDKNQTYTQNNWQKNNKTDKTVTSSSAPLSAMAGKCKPAPTKQLLLQELV